MGIFGGRVSAASGAGVYSSACRLACARVLVDRGGVALILAGAFRWLWHPARSGRQSGKTS